jgi:hypothetical protein
MQRARFLRASVLSLGLAVLFLPVPFIAVTSETASAAVVTPKPSATTKRVKALAIRAGRGDTITLAQDDPKDLPGSPTPSPSTPGPTRTRVITRTVTATPPPAAQVPDAAPVVAGFRLPEPVIWVTFLIGLGLVGITLRWNPEADELKRENELSDFWYRPTDDEKFIPMEDEPEKG